MKFRSLSKEEKRLRDGEWRRWFAWYPIRMKLDGSEYIVWLQTIERRTVYGYWESPTITLYKSLDEVVKTEIE